MEDKEIILQRIRKGISLLKLGAVFITVAFLILAFEPVRHIVLCCIVLFLCLVQIILDWIQGDMKNARFNGITFILWVFILAVNI